MDSDQARSNGARTAISVIFYGCFKTSRNFGVASTLSLAHNHRSNVPNVPQPEMKLIDIIGVKKEADPNEAKADEGEIDLDRAINRPSKANAIEEARRPVSRCSE